MKTCYLDGKTVVVSMQPLVTEVLLSSLEEHDERSGKHVYIIIHLRDHTVHSFRKQFLVSCENDMP